VLGNYFKLNELGFQNVLLLGYHDYKQLTATYENINIVYLYENYHWLG